MLEEEETEPLSQEDRSIVYFWETIESPGPGKLYKTCDGITRFQRLGLPTTTITRRVSVTESDDRTSHGKTHTKRPKGGAQAPLCALQNAVRRCQPTPTIAPNGTEFVEPPETENGVPIIYEDCPGNVRGNCDVHVAHEEVVLFYWPQNITRNFCAPRNQVFTRTNGQQTASSPRVVTIPAVTFRGQDLYWIGWSSIGGSSSFTTPKYVGMSVMNGPFTFTSPTIYLAHHPITFKYADFSNLPSPTSRLSVRSAGIVELKSKDVSSISSGRNPGVDFSAVESDPKYDMEYASLVAGGKFRKTRGMYGAAYTLPLDFADLQDPVPAWAYFDARSDDCWGKQTHCGTITDDSYRPRLVIDPSVWAPMADPNYGQCHMPDLVDPAVALTAIPSQSWEVDSPPLPSLRRGSSRIDGSLAQGARATDPGFPLGTVLPQAPMPAPNQFWPLPTPTSSSTSGSTRGDNNRPGVGTPRGPNGISVDSGQRNGHGPSHNDPVVYTSGSSNPRLQFMLEKGLISLVLSIFSIVINWR